MENSIHKTRAAHLSLSAILKAFPSDAHTFAENCNRHDNLTATVIDAFANLDYREQRVIGMRLGFDTRANFTPAPVYRYREIATAFELTCDATASKIFHRACRKIATFIMEAT